MHEYSLQSDCIINHPCGNKLKVIHISIIIYQLVVQITPKLCTDSQDKASKEIIHAKVSCSDTVHFDYIYKHNNKLTTSVCYLLCL